jgi:hypothetical protein
MAARAGMHRWTASDDAWLAEHYEGMTDIAELADDIERELGFRTTPRTIYVHANRMGLHKRRLDNHEGRAERTVHWTREPEMQAWMLANDHGQRTDRLSDEFRAEFGFGLSRPQITAWRQINGRSTRMSHSGGRTPLPVGAERIMKGYVFVKVRDRPNVGGTKDNWELKQRWMWERAHGEPVPDGCCVMFADHDTRNFSPENLVAVPRRIMARLNDSGMEWHDAEELATCVRIIELQRRANELDGMVSRTCAVCGRKFRLTEAQLAVGNRRVVTCPDCLAAHHKYKGKRRYKGASTDGGHE